MARDGTDNICTLYVTYIGLRVIYYQKGMHLFMFDIEGSLVSPGLCVLSLNF
jgi:hypothetical protein